jgi:hypothetical protein
MDFIAFQIPLTPCAGETFLFLALDVPARKAFSNLFLDKIKSAFSSVGILISDSALPPAVRPYCSITGLHCFGECYVSSARIGCEVLRAELDALGLLDSARISWRDEGTWRPLHPAHLEAFDPEKFFAETKEKIDKHMRIFGNQT